MGLYNYIIIYDNIITLSKYKDIKKKYNNYIYYIFSLYKKKS